MPQLPPTIKEGSKGEAVKGLQNALNAKSSVVLSVDGVFGSGTESAVKQFQSDNGLDVDGIVGPATWGALYVYVVQQGDTLSDIAREQLGEAERWHDLHNLNQALVSDPNKIHPGQVLVLPIYAH